MLIFKITMFHFVLNHALPWEAEELLEDCSLTQSLPIWFDFGTVLFASRPYLTLTSLHYLHGVCCVRGSHFTLSFTVINSASVT